jgi:hypothetical protein
MGVRAYLLCVMVLHQVTQLHAHVRKFRHVGHALPPAATNSCKLSGPTCARTAA